MKTRRLAELGLLTALALIIFILELRLPNLSAIPGIKLGLANIITVYAVFRYKPQETAMLVTSRVLLGAMFSGNLSALLYSAAGAALCLAGMLGVRRIIPPHWIWLSSMLGAIFHNIGQTLAAMCVMRSAAILGYLPVLLFSGCIAGLFTGLAAQLVLARLHPRKPDESSPPRP